jgi:MFS transporter, DHA2 family, multidrug resistance protein
MPSFVAFIVGALVTPLLVRRVRPAIVMAAGLAVAASGYGLLAQVDVDSALALLVTASIVFSLGEALVFTLATDLIVGVAPPERAGAAAAISETSSELGGALGIAILGSIGTAVYRGQVADSVPAGVPPAATETAKDTLGGAVETAETLPGGLGADLLDAAREAFVQGMQVAALTAAVIAAGMAVLTVFFLRHVGVGSEQEESKAPEQAGSSAPATAAAVAESGCSGDGGRP